MPVVLVYMWSGVSSEAKRNVVSGITRVFEGLGIPRDAVEVIVVEVPKENWGLGGELASERFGQVRAP